MIKHLWSFLFGIIPFLGFSQSYTFSTYSIADGLAQSQVTAIHEDANGYLWVGTLGGLSSFNGGAFQNYSAEDGLLNNRITALYPENERLWIGHENGISIYHQKKFSHWVLPDKKNTTSVSGIINFQQQSLIATNGSGLFIFKDNQLASLKSFQDADQNRIRAVAQAGGRLFLASRAGLIVTRDLKHFHRIPDQLGLNLTDVVPYQNKLILSTTDGRIVEYDLIQKKFRVIYELPQLVFINDCQVNQDGSIWVTSELGLSYLSKGNQQLLIDESNGLPFNHVSCIYTDINQTLWLGSEGKGLFYFAGRHVNFFNKKYGFPSDLVTSVTQLKDGTFFFGTYDSGLIQYDEKTYQTLELPNNTVWATEVDAQGFLWVGTSNALYKTRNGKVLEQYQGDEKATCFLKNRDGTILCGGSFGILKIQGDQTSLLSLPSDMDQVGTIRQLTRFKGRLMCAADGGVFEFQNGHFKRFLNFRQGANTIHCDQNNNIWIGTENGLFWSDGEQSSRFSLSEQPAANLIYFLESDQNRLLVGTNNGLFLLSNLDKQQNAQVRFFGKDEGLVNLETNFNSGYFDRDKKFWFGTAEGLVCIDLSVAENLTAEKAPFLQVLSIKLNFQDFDYRKYSRKLNTQGLPMELVLPPDKNNLLLELDGIALKHHKTLRYEYKLIGLSDQWSPSFSSPFITLSNLSSGNYQLMVRVKNRSGKTSESYLLNLTIKPHFYKTWWFLMLNGLILALSIYGFLKFRINREREKQYKERLEFKTRLLGLEQQSLNASMNRHFIFNSLNSIQYFINTQDRRSANKYLTNFAKLIRKNLDASAEVDNMVSLQQEMERLELYLSLESMRFKDRFDYRINTHDIDLELIRVPSMLFQPFVENSIIHGILPLQESKGQINIDLSIHDETLHVLIEDNGVGIENSLSKKGNFQGDHQSRGMEITSKRIGLLKKLSHLEYELEGPYQYDDPDRSINGTRVLIKIPLGDLYNS
ncbi:MAG: hypothetical protein EP338_05655 [Bacteroidetes bacterium]|nr:MAG: hypothetical protein EP338_05655 [Bacteroidota bacterium]